MDDTSSSAQTQRSEIIWFLLVAGAVLTAASLPYVIGQLTEPPGFTFAGALIAPDDTLSYLAKMQQGALGSWVFNLPYTGQSHPGVPFVYSYYILLGHVAHWLNLPNLLVFHLARVINGFCLLTAIYLLITKLSDVLSERRIIFLVASTSSGLGWLALPLGYYLSTDLVTPESNTFLTLFDNAHFPLAQAGLCTIYILLAAPFQHRWLQTAALIVLMAILTVIQPFAWPAICIVAFFFAAFHWKNNWPALLSASATILPALTIGGILFGAVWYVLRSNPLLNAWSLEANMWSPHPLYFISGYGLLWVGAIVGGRVALSRKRPIDLMLLIWLGVTIIMVYIPISVQRRFAMGLHIPLAALAGLGLYRWQSERHWSSAQRQVFMQSVVLITAMTNIAIVVLFSAGPVLHNPKLYVRDDEKAVLVWIKDNAEANRAILSSTELGRFVPVYSSGRAISGHGMETVNAEEAQAEVLEFYNDATTAERRQEIIAKHEVVYVIFGPREASLDAVARNCLDGLTLLTQIGEVALYQVE